MNFTYLILLGLSISFPLSASFEKRVRYATNWHALFPAISITAVFFIVWDIIFTSTGVWGFNHDYTLDSYLFSLPIEEWIFFIVIPFSTVFIYECVGYFLPNLSTSKGIKSTYIALSVVLLATGLLNSDKVYTFWNFLFAGVFILGTAIRNPSWLAKFTVAYGFHLIPFLLVNGILTGSLLDDPIVWYDNNENLGIRLVTIPIEDTIYSMLLLLMNVRFFEYFRERRILKT